MPEDDEQPEKIWDEYDWERFLQQQDQKTEKYMELLEKYLDHPNRDQIIAREMGWFHLLDKDGEKWAEEVDSNFDDSLPAGFGEEGDSDEPDLEEDETCEGHPLYQSSVVLQTWFDTVSWGSAALAEHPASVLLSLNASIASNKLAAALSDDDAGEIGMTIAYLKRALKAITVCLECSAQLHREGSVSHDTYGQMNQRLFHVRDGIIHLMGTYRSEFRRRYEGK